MNTCRTLHAKVRGAKAGYRTKRRFVSTTAATGNNELNRELPSQSKQTKLREHAQHARYQGLTGGQIFHDMMRAHGVRTVFGYPGGAILPVFDAIYESPHFEFILTRHEQGVVQH